MFGRSISRLMLITLPVLAGCMKGPQPIADADKATIRASNDKFVQLTLAKNWPGVAAMFTTNGTLMAPNQPIASGRAAVQTWMAAFPPLSAFKLTSEEIDGAGDV